jgi:signal transduction histidine kinase
MAHNIMHRSITGILIVFFFLSFLSPLKTNAQGKVKNVVVFFSYGSNLPAFENILSGLKSTIRGGRDETINIIPEYLDISRSENEEYTRFIISMYNNKLKEFKVDLLITVGPGINAALLKYGNSALKALKMINVDFDIPGRTTLRDLNVKDGIEVFLRFQVGKTLKEDFAMFPEYQDVFVISGVSRLDSFYTTLVRQSKSEFEPVHRFTFITNLTMDSTIRFVRTIPPSSIVVVPLYMKDAANIPFTTPEALDIISRNSRAPVFLPVTDAGVKTRGSIGGYLFSYVKLGEEIGRISREIVNGKPMNAITVDENAFYAHIYDWNELKRWHLTESKVIPANSIFYNKDISFLELYKWYILGLLLFVLSQTILIIYLFRLNKRQRAINLQMEETEGMYRDLIRTDRLSKMSTLTASLSHELFQPLAAIRMTAQAGKRFVQTGRLDMTKASQMFENILEDDLRATGIISSVKSFLKPESREMESLSLNALILETVNIVRSDAKKQGIRIDLKLEADPVFIHGDKIQIQQVLMNFIRNAAGAMEKCDPGNRNLEIKLTSTGEFVTVSVSDSGPGIDSAIKDKLFKPFVTTRKDGFGIGLTLCRSIIEKHHGKIWMDDVPEGGARFSFSLHTIRNT